MRGLFTNKTFSLRRIAIIFFLFVLLATGLGQIFETSLSGGATYTTLEEKWKGSYANWQFKFKGYNGYGLCAYDSKKSAPVKANGTVNNVTHEGVIKLAYYILYKNNETGISRNDMKYTHVYFSYKMNGKNSLTDHGKDILNDALEWAKIYEKKPMPPSYEQFKVYQWIPTGENKGMQPVVFFSYVTPAQLNLIKKASDPKVMSTGAYSMDGIEYTVYKADKETVVGKLITDGESGETNILTLVPGDYYVRETKTPPGSGFEINETWLSAKLESGNTLTLKTEGTASEKHIPAKVYVEKEIEGNEAAIEPFEFEIINVNDNSISYTISTSTGRNPRSEPMEILAGTYRVIEKPADGYESLTQPYEFSVSPNETYRIKWKNKMLHNGQLSISKTNLDGLSPEGFKFELDGILFKKIRENGNIKYITEEELSVAEAISLAGIDNDAVTYDEERYSLGEWVPNSEDLERINDAAREGLVGEYKLRFSNEFTSLNIDSYPSTPVEINTTINLSNMVENSGEFAGRSRSEASPRQAEIRVEDDSGDDRGITITYNEWAELCGARTRYLDADTGKEYTEIIIGNENSSIDQIPYGRYTVQEVMNHAQSARYHSDDGKEIEYKGKNYIVKTSLTKDITAESNIQDYTFVFENIPRSSHVKLRKSSEYGDIEGIRFRLRSTGNTGSGDSYDSEFVTNERGEIDFGNLYKGEYVLEEITFDSDKYVNTYPLGGHSRPAIRFQITGNESGTVWLGGEPGNGGTSIGSENEPSCTFVNQKYTELLISKVDGDTDIFLPGVWFEIRDDSDRIVASFITIRNDEGLANVDMIEHLPNVKGGCVKDGEGDKEYIVIKGLDIGKKYRLIETDAPYGYIESDVQEFTFDDSMRIDLKNYVPDINTRANDSMTESNIGLAGAETVIIDKVEYEKVIPGREYELRGSLMYGGGDFISEEKSRVLSYGKPVTSSVVFVPEEASGEQEVEFRFNTDGLDGKNIVVFEKLYLDGEEIVSHNDENNMEQTIAFPRIETSASLEGTEVIDVVSYENLLSNRRYICRGWLVDQKTGEKVKNSDGFNVFYVKEAEECGETEVSLKIPENSLNGRLLTAFEELYIIEEDIDSETGIPTVTKETLIAEHKDLNDEAQTVNTPYKNTPKTGDELRNRIFMILALLSMSGGVLVVLVIKKLRKNATD